MIPFFILLVGFIIYGVIRYFATKSKQKRKEWLRYILISILFFIAIFLILNTTSRYLSRDTVPVGSLKTCLVYSDIETAKRCFSNLTEEDWKRYKEEEAP